MPLITDKIKENAEKCKQCIFLKLRDEINRNSVIYDEAIASITGLCVLCPYAKDFEMVYGMKPYEYFPMKSMKVKDK